MRKTKKYSVLLVAASVMTLGFCFNSMAATNGWQQENDVWHYYENGEEVTDAWRKSAVGQWFYLGDDGEMRVNSWVDNYYVGGDGALTANDWRKLYSEDEDPMDVESEENWYYFSNTGVMVQDTWKKINNKWYSFESDGVMNHGWFDDGRYYLGDENDGSMKEGWVYLEEEIEGRPSLSENWFYFSPGGVKVSDYVDKKINGRYYSFDADGKMLYGWADVTNKVLEDSSLASYDIKDYKYYGLKSDGYRINDWRKISGPVNIGSDNYEEYWFYLKNGKPYYADDNTNAVIKTINNNKYCFNEYGEMRSGIQKITASSSDGTASEKTYYFGKADDGALKVGRQSVYVEDDNTTYTYYFNTSGTYKGQGITGVKDSCVYVNGKRLDADKDLRYQVVSNGTETRLVNTSGKIQKATSDKGKVFEDLDGNKFTVDRNGEITSPLPNGYHVKSE